MTSDDFGVPSRLHAQSKFLAGDLQFLEALEAQISQIDHASLMTLPPSNWDQHVGTKFESCSPALR